MKNENDNNKIYPLNISELSSFKIEEEALFPSCTFQVVGYEYRYMKDK